MIQAKDIQIMLFTILFICFILYLFLGIYSYTRDKKSKINIIFLILCICTSLWAIGYAFMLISPNIKTANIWRIVCSFGWCFFSAIWLSFIFSFKNTTQKNFSSIIQLLAYILSIIFFISNLLYEPSKIVGIQTYGFVDNVTTDNFVNTIFNIYMPASNILGLLIIYLQGKDSQKNRVKAQMKTIFITSLVSFCLVFISDMLLPTLGIVVFPLGIISMLIGTSGMWYAINKYKMMSLSYELVSEYIFESINEPIFILGEDFLVKNCNEASLNITGYYNKDLEQNSLYKIINFRNFNFNNIIQTGNVVNIEVDLYKKNKESLVCELSVTVIYDEYKDIIGILTLLHDVSEKKRISEIQKQYTFKLQESNVKLKNEITDRILAEDKIQHYIYYDSLTDLCNRKKMQEDINILLDNKKEKFAVLFMDLDKFKSANDNYGHLAGDNVLKTVAGRLKSIIRSTDTVYRIGGDEFIIILRNLKELANAEKIADAIKNVLTVAFTYKENKIFVSACIGISIYPEHGIDEDTLIKRADLAMYELKRKGGNGYKIYYNQMEKDLG